MKLKNNKLNFYLLWPVLLSVLWFLAGIALLSVEKKAAGLVFAAGLLYLLASLMMFVARRRSILHDYVEFAMDFGQVQKRMLRELKVPFGICDSEGLMLWSNDEFCQISQKERKGYRVKDILGDVKAFSLPKQDLEDRVYKVMIGSRYCKVLLRMMETPAFQEETQIKGLRSRKGETERLIAVYLYDETELVLLRQENYDQKMVIGLLYLDNYDEVLESIEAVKRSLLTALIDRKINMYMQEIDAVIKKLEKDKYIFVFQNKYFAQLDEKKFSLLEEVRSVSMGNAENSITISMGIALNSESYAKGYDEARAAIDLALGRGGDQVVVKDGERITYYGGKSESLEKNTRVKARSMAKALREFIERNDQVLIMGHVNGDLDSFGASIGMYRIAKFLGKKANIVLNEVGSKLRPMSSRFMNNDEYEEDLFVSNLKAQELAGSKTLLIVVDVNRPQMTECPPLFERIDQVVVVDHHRKASDSIENAILSYVEAYASSACELVTEILQYIGDGIRLRPLEAEAMYAGVMIDTNNFMTKTGVRTFEAAAYLRKSGADVTRIRKAFRSDITEYMQKAKAISQMENYMGCFALAQCDPQGVESPTILGAQIANDLMEIIGIKASFVFTDYKGKIYVSARSIDEVNVQVVMERLGNGGGHMSVAGAQLTDCTVVDAMDKVKSILAAMVRNGEISDQRK